MAKIRKMIFYIFSTLLSLLLAFCLADIAHLREQYSTYADLVDEQRNNWIVDQHQLEQCVCTVPIESKPISQEDFINKYAFKSPVVFRRSASPNDRNMLFTQACQLDNLARNYGNKVITVSTANTHSYAKSSMKLSDYLNEYVKPHGNSNNNDQFNPTLKYGNETWYFFGENNYAEWKELFDLYERPAYELPDHHHAYSFGIAAAGTGVPFHFHGPGFAETIVGRKRWFLYEPSNKPRFDPNKSTLHWFMENYIHLSGEQLPMECVLEPLDIIYFPDRWWHATLNVDNGVFISTFLSPT